MHAFEFIRRERCSLCDMAAQMLHELAADPTTTHHVDDDDALVHVHLCGGQADAFGLVHGLEHVVDQLANAVVHDGHGLGHLVKAGIWKGEDGQQGHGVSG